MRWPYAREKSDQSIRQRFESRHFESGIGRLGLLDCHWLDRSENMIFKTEKDF